jgi:glycosyltransferase involved in cell wall biosynthesis
MISGPLVSIGLPVFNGDKHVGMAIDAIRSQTFQDFELIISDNASTDGTGAICSRYAARDARIRYIRQPENCGAVANFEFVLREAAAPLFVWFAADDACEADWLALLVECHQNDPEVALAASDITDVDVDGRHVGVTRLDEIRPDPGGNWRRQRALFFRNPTSSIFFAIYGLYRRADLISLPIPMGSGLRYVTGSEIPLLAQIACKGKIVAVSKAVKKYRWNPEGMFNREQAKMKPWNKVHNHVEISTALLEVINKARLPLLDKIPLYFTVFVGFFFGTAKLTAQLMLVQFGR